MNTDSENAKPRAKSSAKSNAKSEAQTQRTPRSQRAQRMPKITPAGEIFVLSEIPPPSDSWGGIKSVCQTNLLSFPYQCLSVFICGLSGLPFLVALVLKAGRGGAKGIGDVLIGRQEFEVLRSNGGEQVERNLERRFGIIYQG